MRDDWDAEGATEARIPADLLKTPDERLAEARAAWRRAQALEDEEAVWQAALGLQHAQAWEDAIGAYALIAERFRGAGARAALGAGDCFLYSVYARSGVPREERVRALETALDWYDRALSHGHPRNAVEPSYWAACEMLLDAHGGHRMQQLAALARYQDTFPDGAHVPEAHRRLASLSP